MIECTFQNRNNVCFLKMKVEFKINDQGYSNNGENDKNTNILQNY